VINYRFGGLAEKFCKTHPIVLAKIQKIGVRSIKDTGRVYVWKVGFSRGLSTDLPRHMNRSKDYRKH
jgi:hypothetical protein